MHKNVGYQSGANLAEPQKEQQMTQEIAFRPFRSIQCRILRQSQVRRTFLFAFQAGSPLVRSFLASLTLLAVAMAAPVAAAQKVALFIDVSKPGPKIDRNLFGRASGRSAPLSLSAQRRHHCGSHGCSESSNPGRPRFLHKHRGRGVRQIDRRDCGQSSRRAWKRQQTAGPFVRPPPAQL